MKNVLDDVVRAGHAISRGFDIRYFIASLVEQLFDITGVNLACFYSLEGDRARLLFRRGLYDIPELLSPEEDPFQFVLDSRETVVLTERKESPFLPLLLHREMNSGVLSPLLSGSKVDAFIILNSRDPQFFDRQRLRFTEALVKLAGEFYHNTVLHNRLREYTRKIQALERYQENIFTSMTNLLLTTDTEGHIRYYNRAAGEKFSLNPEDVGKTIGDVLGRGMGRKMLGVIDSSIGEGEEIVGAEGIYRGEKEEMDFSLTTAPLVTRRQKHEGLTLIFTDQSRERELEKKVKSVKEERRLIKDMFSRYLSQEIVSQMVRNPDIVHLGGDKKVATVMFADIRGYTAFSEGRDPEFIIKILNEYFSEAVELVIQNRGYIDKFIGDCIMAAWGVPLTTPEEDAHLAVSCALDIQKLTTDTNRTFFTGEARNLRIGMGMHTGPLVAGNIGSVRRADYTVIGDTVNVAARLEGVAGPGDIIITEDTRSYLGDSFSLQKKRPVRVKGKTEPLKIYNVKAKVV